jgi:hypothetical protein
VIVRFLNLIVIGALVMAAAYVYRIKFDSTVQAERLAKLRTEVRRERDTIASLRAEWGELDNPARIEALAKRFLKLKEIVPTQFDTLDHLPDQPPDYMRPGAKDPIGGMIENLEEPVAITGTIAGPNAAGAPNAAAPSPAADSPSPASSDTGAPAQ